MRGISIGLALGTLVLAGCGQDANRDDVRAVTTRFYSALTTHQGSTACAQLRSETIKQLEQDEKATCAKAIGEVGLTPSRIARVEVFEIEAKVDLANGASAFLEQTAGGWKISALGCRPTEGDPTEQPLGCAVES